jgi:hypothetical protein
VATLYPFLGQICRTLPTKGGGLFPGAAQEKVFNRTLDSCFVLLSIRRMNPNDWLEKAEQLRTELARLPEVRRHEDRETLERAVIARFLRHQFSGEPPEDTATIPLFALP